MSRGASIADVLEGRARWHLARGDCLEVLLAIGDGAAAHVISDPPYSAHVHAAVRQQVPAAERSRAGGDEAPALRSVDLGFAHLSDELRAGVAREAARIAMRWVLLFCDVEGSHAWRQSLEACGLDYCRTGAWIRTRHTPQWTGDRPAVGFDAIVIAHRAGRKRWNRGGCAAIWQCAQEQGHRDDRVHPTQKPLDLMLDLVRDFTDDDEIVIDPFAGSGTTGVACLRLGRRFIGVERLEPFAAVAIERLEAEQAGLTLRQARAGQTALFGDRDATPMPPHAAPPLARGRRPAKSQIATEAPNGR